MTQPDPEAQILSPEVQALLAQEWMHPLLERLAHEIETHRVAICQHPESREVTFAIMTPLYAEALQHHPTLLRDHFLLACTAFLRRVNAIREEANTLLRRPWMPDLFGDLERWLMGRGPYEDEAVEQEALFAKFDDLLSLARHHEPTLTDEAFACAMDSFYQGFVRLEKVGYARIGAPIGVELFEGFPVQHHAKKPN